MSIEFNIETNFPHLKKLFEDLGEKDVTNAARTSLNKAIRRGATQGLKVIKLRVNLKSAMIKERMETEKAYGSVLRNLEVALRFSGQSISMRHFITGHKKPINQKGVKIKKRRVLKAKVKYGKKIKLNGAFIQKGNSGNVQVFRHIGKSRKMRKVSTKSLAAIVVEERMNAQINRIVEKRFERQFPKELEFRQKKSMGLFNKKPMKKL